jgi:hypothetical protein
MTADGQDPLVSAACQPNSVDHETFVLLRPANVRRFSRSEAPASLRAERHAALPDVFNHSASGVTPCAWGCERRFSAGRGERPAVGCEQQLGGVAGKPFLVSISHS